MAGRLLFQPTCYLKTGSQVMGCFRAHMLQRSLPSCWPGNAFRQKIQCRGPDRRLERTLITCSAAVAEATQPRVVPQSSREVRVRFAPSPTGNLHVGGARTALFNYLFARNMGGKLILRIEDTDAARSTRESEEAVLRDLQWLGIQWDEGPDVGGECGPYRQSERKEIYKSYVDELVEKNLAYPCFCTDEELSEMKRQAEAQNLPPVYRGKWGTASEEEVKEAKAQGLPYCYRFRVPKDEEITIDDAIRDKVTWNTNTLGDFVVLRSNGLPVYNFCVAIDDALMRITHVIRAEEHLPNTLRQVLIYRALGFPTPTFGHVSLILAPDRSKLSKRHGATSVGEFKEEGYLPEAMVNYLSLLGWNDGTEQEIFSLQDLQDKFSLDRVTKSGAVFDKTKLGWMNGQHLRSLPDEDVEPMIASVLTESGLLHKTASPFVHAATNIMKGSLELITDCDAELREYLSYPLEATLDNEAAAEVVADDFKQVAEALLAAYDSGELVAMLQADGAAAFKKFLKTLGKEQGRKGKRLFMPARIAFTGSMHGPDVGDLLCLLLLEDGDVAEAGAFVPLADRMERLRSWLASH